MDQETKKEFKEIKNILKNHENEFKILNNKFDKKFDILAAAIKSNQTGIKENQKEIQKQGVLAERRDEKIQQLFEAVVSHNEAHDTPPTKKNMSSKLENHENRISSLETRIKEL